MVQTDSDADADAAKSRRFQQLALPHLDAAYNLARWLCGNPNDAEDVVQEAFMRAFRFFDTFRGDSARPWLLAIVRRTWYTEWRRRAPSHDMLEFDETMDDATLDGWSAGGDDPQTLLIRDEDARQVHDALARLPVEYREVLILRELEEMGYREIAVVADVPIGTVMSRLARGRRKLAEVLMAQQRGGGESVGGGRKGGQGDRRGSTQAPQEQGAQSGRVVQSAAAAPSESSTPCARSDRPPRNSGDGRAASSAVVPATATVTQLRAFADGRPLNIPGAAADPAQETPDGL
ncbi:RNA polymerase sigma-70 factor (ECF subfamily) [Paraburkholderia sp. HC6.4b]|uniref:RNA polymerase sigma factor n=1 Tax=unclassified Paraburkholderia TaxID=2615204 RepID=UPI001615C1E2|nr:MULTISPECIES: RNA polymerase sigma factor [unclassified Paraburkholderia]MBB5412003.1 RNA polymerase sigma-70 factor (ECF subfamily) [Paraburkholderia sp. HC6.4b]MBB5454070.1 RNA polymerase sigma-70 factor (ECF subfamily) [Paraburkholderia sp. Kb1A]